MADRKLSITITGDASKAKKAVADLDQSLAKAEKTATKSGSGIKSSMATLGIGAALYGAAKAFDESAKVAAQTEAVIKSTGNAANITADGVAGLAGELSKKAGVDDEAIQSGANLIATFTNIRNEAGKGNDVFDQTTKAALDMSVAMGTDMKSAAMQLGKALNDPTAGVTKLARAGVQFTEQQKEQIKTLQASGDMLGAQKIILAEVEKQFGGSAEAQATAMGKAQVAVDNLAESVGGVLMPVVATAADGLTAVADALGGLPQPVQTSIVMLGGAAIAWAKWGDSARSAFDTAKSAGSKVKAAASNVDNLGGKMAKGAGAAGILGVAMVGVGIALDSAAELAERTAKAQENLNEAIAGAKVPDDGLTQYLNDIWSNGDVGNIIKEKIGSVEELRRVINLSDADYRKWTATLSEQDQTMFGLQGAVTSLRYSYDEARRTARDTKKDLDKLADAGETLAVQNAVVGASTELIVAGFQRVSEETGNAGDAIQEFYDDTTSALEGTIGIEEALDSLTESVIENGNALGAQDEAGRNNLKTFLDVKDGIAELGAELARSGATTDEQIFTMSAYAGQLQQTARDAGYTEEQIAFMIQQMGLTPEQIRTTVLTNSPQVKAGFEVLKNVIQSTPGSKNISVTEQGANYVIEQLRRVAEAARRAQQATIYIPGIPGFASGTESAPGGMAIVGEEGPELVKLPKGASVKDAQTTRSILSKSNNRGSRRNAAPRINRAGWDGTGGGDTHIHIHAGLVADRERVVDEIVKGLNARQRRSGSRPILVGVSG